MGSTHSFMSPEATVAAVCVTAVAAVAIGASQFTPSATKLKSKSTSKDSGSKKSKSKSKKSAPADEFDFLLPAVAEKVPVVEFPSVIPGGFGGADEADTGVETDEVKGANSKKNKKKKKKSAAPEITLVSPAASSLLATPAAAETPKAAQKPKADTAPTVPAPAVPAKSKSKSKKAKSKLAGLSTSNLAPSASLSTDDSWMNVTPSPAVPAEESEEEEEQAEEEDFPAFLLGRQAQSRFSSNVGRKPLAERLAPKPRKTAVDDMLETPDHPVIARVMRVSATGEANTPEPAAAPTPLPVDAPVDLSASAEQEQAEPGEGYASGEYDDDETSGPDAATQDEDDGWGVVKSKGRKTTTSATTQSGSSRSSTNSEALTKRQRQNAAKRDAQKEAKSVGEAARLATLSIHKKELERTKMLEQFAQREKGSSGKGVKSGGMTASLDEGGKLVWE